MNENFYSNQDGLKLPNNLQSLADRIGALIENTASTRAHFVKLSNGMSSYTEASLSKMLSGTQSISIEFLCDIAEAYHLSLDWLLTGKENQVSSDIKKQQELRHPSFELIEKLQMIAESVALPDFPFDAACEDEEDDMFCGSRMKAIRCAHGLSVEAQSKLLSVSVHKIYRAEMSENLPSFEFLRAFCAAYSLPFDFVVFGVPRDFDYLVGEILAPYSFASQLKIVRAWSDLFAS